jgi:hypothetical protein
LALIVIALTSKMPKMPASLPKLVRERAKMVHEVRQETIMDTNKDTSIRSRAERAISDLVMAELFLVQATIESASALSDGISNLRDHLYWDEAENQPKEELSAFIKRTRAQVVEPYSIRFKYLRDMREQDAA